VCIIFLLQCERTSSFSIGLTIVQGGHSIISNLPPSTLTVQTTTMNVSLPMKVPNLDFSIDNFALGGCDPALGAYGGPAPDLFRLVNSVATQGSVASLTAVAPCSNCIYTLDFYGPALQCINPTQLFQPKYSITPGSLLRRKTSTVHLITQDLSQATMIQTPLRVFPKESRPYTATKPLTAFWIIHPQTSRRYSSLTTTPTPLNNVACTMRHTKLNST
jgi:hypothetical protein